MKSRYVVVVREGVRAERVFKAQEILASNPHYAVRQVIERVERSFPRGWSRLHIEVYREPAQRTPRPPARDTRRTLLPYSEPIDPRDALEPHSVLDLADEGVGL